MSPSSCAPNSKSTAPTISRLSSAHSRHSTRSIACWAVGGGFDYILQIVTRDIDSYQRLIDHLLEARIGLARYFTYVVTKAVKSAPPPLEQLLDLPEREGPAGA